MESVAINGIWNTKQGISDFSSDGSFLNNGIENLHTGIIPKTFQAALS